MRLFIVLGIISLCLLLSPYAKAQTNWDCVSAVVICSDSLVDFNPLTSGIPDFDNPNNDNGCLASPEDQSAWYYFEFRTDMPPNSVIEFTIDPTGTSTFPEDYDFAIFGPNLTCDSLGSPVRCSFANTFTSGTVQTGLGNGAVDTSEDAQGDGFLAPMVVQPGDGFYLLLQNFLGNSEGFTLTWGGSAKPYLNCLTNQSCDLSLTAQNDTTVCSGSIFDLSVGVNSTGIVTYTWSGSDNGTSFLSDINSGNPTVNIPDDFSGNITYTIIGTEGECSSTATMTVSVLGNPEPEILGVDTICPNTLTTLSLSESYNTYLWSNNSTDPQIDINSPGTYTVMVENDIGCQGEDEIIIETYEVAPPVIEGETEFCSGIGTQLSVGTIYNSYLWSTGETEPSIEVDFASTIILEVIDSNGCRTSSSIDLLEHPSPLLEINGDSILCFGSSIQLSGTTGFETYTWSDGINSESIEIDSAGLYTLEAIDINGCLALDSIEVMAIDEILPQISGDTNLCEGQIAILELTNGFSIYEWSTGESDSTITIDTAGVYSVQVEDENGCSGNATFEVLERPSPEFDIQGDTAFCQGGSSVLSVPDGFTSYLWSTNSSARSIEVFASNTYLVEVGNEFGCKTLKSLEVEAFANPQPVILGVENFCEGDSIQLSATPGYDGYIWSTGSGDLDIYVSEPGIVSLEVVDQRGCRGETAAQIGMWFAPDPEILGDTVFCSMTSTTLQVQGNFPFYRWSTGETNMDLTVTEGGTYELTVTDGNGCNAITVVDIEELEPSLLEVPNEVAFCTGESIDISAGGQFTIYDWSTGSQDSVISVSSPGTITVSVTNQWGCMDQDTILVIQNPLPEPTLSTEGVLCENGTTVLNTQAIFENYQWSSGGDSSSLTISQGGIYSVTVENSFGCIATASLEVEALPSPEPSVDGSLSFCEGESTILDAGIFERYIWTTGAETQSIQVDQDGIFGVTVTDTNGCTGTWEENIEILALPDFSVMGDNFYCQGASTILNIEGSFSSFNWEGEAENEPLEIDKAGNYTVYVTAENNCLDSTSVTILEIERPLADAGQDTSLTCIINQVSIGGEMLSPGLYTWEGPGIFSSNKNLPRPTVEIPGTYILTVTDTSYQCDSEQAIVEVFEKREIPALTIEGKDTLDCNFTEVILEGKGFSIEENHTFRWTNSQQEMLEEGEESHITVNEADIYILELTNTSTGCQAIDSIQVVNNQIAPLAFAGQDQVLSCIDSVLALDGTNAEDISNIKYSWESVEGHGIENKEQPSILINEPGTYVLLVQNLENGCESFDTVQVSSNKVFPGVAIDGDPTLDCITNETTLVGRALSDPAAVAFQWKREGNEGIIFEDQAFTISESGIFELQTIDLTNGCISSERIEVTVNTNVPSEVQIDLTPPLCVGESSGQIEVMGVNGGMEPYLYSIDEEGFSNETAFEGLKAGRYDLTIQDAQGCEYRTEIDLSDGTPIYLDLGEDQHIQLGDKVTLRSYVGFSERVERIEWFTQDSLHCMDCPRIEVQPIQDETKYFATLYDEMGCMVTDSVMIFVDRTERVYIPNAFSPNDDGSNDRFTVFSGDQVVNIKSLQIFDRWGEVVFTGEDIPSNRLDKGWDGKLNNRPMSIGVYVYMAVVEFIDGQEIRYTGDVTLVR